VKQLIIIIKIQFIFKKTNIFFYNKNQRFDVIESFRQYLSISSGTYMEKILKVITLNIIKKKKIIIKINDIKKYYEDELEIMFSFILKIIKYQKWICNYYIII